LERDDRRPRVRGRRANRRGPSLYRILWYSEDRRYQPHPHTNSVTQTAAHRGLLAIDSYGHQPGVVVVIASGEIDRANSSLLRYRFTEQLASAPRRIVIDISRVTFLGSDGISELITAYRLGCAYGIDIALVAPHGVALRALTVAGVAALFPVYHTIDEALAGG
jgi:anti-sigma B factor antagonist